MIGELYYDIPEKSYHNIPAVGSSVLGQLDRGGDYLEDYLSKEQGGAHFDFGSAIHLAILQPELFQESVKIGPNSDRRTKEWKEFAKEVPEDSYVITAKEYEDLIDIVNACVEHDLVRQIIDSCEHREVSALWREDGVKCKGRFDLLDLKGGAIFDVKTTAKGVTSDKIRWSIRDFRYNIQAAHYLAGAKAAGYELENYGLIFICKNTKKVRVYELSKATLERAEARRKKLLAWYAAYQKGLVSPQYEIEEIDI